MTAQNEISIGSLTVSNNRPFTLFGGMNVLESRELALEVAATYKEITDRIGIPYVFKASFDKANRSSNDSFRGLGVDRGLEVLSLVKEKLGMPILTDVHSIDEVERVASVVDVLQTPAFLLSLIHI